MLESQATASSTADLAASAPERRGSRSEAARVEFFLRVDDFDATYQRMIEAR
jgi:hypothetical protein